MKKISLDILHRERDRASNIAKAMAVIMWLLSLSMVTGKLGEAQAFAMAEIALLAIAVPAFAAIAVWFSINRMEQRAFTKS